MASVTDIGAVTNPLGGPYLGGPTGWAAAVRDALNSSDVTVDARIASHAGAADPHPGYLTASEGNGLYEALGAVSTHAAASDPHTGYQREVEKAAANGYASLDGTTKVPYAQLPTGTAASTVAIGDHTHAAYLEKAGGTMVGAITLAADPTNALHAATKQYVDGAMPLGVILPYGGTTAPTGWHLCDGSAHGSSALQTLIGSANAPDLRGKFIVGVGDSPDASTPTIYARGDKGGAESVTLGITNLPSHSHGGSTGNETGEHTHGVAIQTGGRNTGHTHWGPTEGVMWITNYNDGHAGGNYTVMGSWAGGAQGGGENTDHSHGVNGNTGGRSASHNHSVTAEGSGTAVNVRPPYYALTYIIKKV
jgi:microcystin-dependent protein